VIPVKAPPSLTAGRGSFVLTLGLAICCAGCGRRGRNHEIAYVSAPQAILRDRVAAVYNKAGVVKNADRVEILERDRRFARVRTAAGVAGWVEQRYLVNQQVYSAFQKLIADNQNTPVQATAVARNDTNLHLEPGRDTEHLYQLNQGAKVSVLKRSTAGKVLPGGQPKPAAGDNKAPPLEDWWLVRDSDQHVGWLLGRMIDVDVPLEVAQYAEGQRIVAFFELNKVTDDDKKVPQYLVLLTDPKDGLPFDYDQIRVFTWNVKRHRYETAYREHNTNGMLPVTVSNEDFGKEGTLPVFVLRVTDDSGKIAERKYKLNTPIVRRVLAPGEEPPKPAARTKPGRAKRARAKRARAKTKATRAKKKKKRR
jgi:SH3-like domain-containing protein